jgi:hypothetical protein
MSDEMWLVLILLSGLAAYAIGYRDGFRAGMKKVYFIIKNKELKL